VEPSPHSSASLAVFFQQLPAARCTHLIQLRFQVVYTAAEVDVLTTKGVQAVLVGVHADEAVCSFWASRQQISQQRRLAPGDVSRSNQVELFQTDLDRFHHHSPPFHRNIVTIGTIHLFSATFPNPGRERRQI
jgi:hypothetical protein